MQDAGCRAQDAGCRTQDAGGRQRLRKGERAHLGAQLRFTYAKRQRALLEPPRVLKRRLAPAEEGASLAFQIASHTRLNGNSAALSAHHPPPVHRARPHAANAARSSVVALPRRTQFLPRCAPPCHLCACGANGNPPQKGSSYGCSRSVSQGVTPRLAQPREARPRAPHPPRPLNARCCPTGTPPRQATSCCSDDGACRAVAQGPPREVGLDGRRSTAHCSPTTHYRSPSLARRDQRRGARAQLRLRHGCRKGGGFGRSRSSAVAPAHDGAANQFPRPSLALGAASEHAREGPADRPTRGICLPRPPQMLHTGRHYRRRRP